MNAISWFEIPCRDLDRAERFYNTLLATSLKREVFGGAPMSIFPHDPKGEAGGCLMAASQPPTSDGVRIYLVVDNLDAALARTKTAGGEVVVPRTAIGEHGFMAHVRDSEGNVVGLHATH
jgi:uncharacterized protein